MSKSVRNRGRHTICVHSYCSICSQVLIETAAEATTIVRISGYSKCQCGFLSSGSPQQSHGRNNGVTTSSTKMVSKLI